MKAQKEPVLKAIIKFYIKIRENVVLFFSQGKNLFKCYY